MKMCKVQTLINVYRRVCVYIKISVYILTFFYMVLFPSYLLTTARYLVEQDRVISP